MFPSYLNFASRALGRRLAHLLFKGLIAMSLVTAGLAHAGVYEDFFNNLMRNDAPAVNRLLQRGFDPNTTGPTGMVALHMAIMERSFSVAETLIQARGIQLDKRNMNDETPLMLAALRGHIELCSLLLAKGADVNKPGWTALHYAASGEQTEILKMLLDHSAYIDAEAPSGNTPLMMAVMYGPESNITVLLEAGADPTLKNNAGRTALDLAQGVSRTGAVKLLLPAIAQWKENEVIEAARMKQLEEQMAQEEAEDQIREVGERAAAAAIQASQAKAEQAEASNSAMKVVDLAPLLPQGQTVAPAKGPFRPVSPGN